MPLITAHREDALPSSRFVMAPHHNMPALVAVQHDPYLRAFYEHLLAKGKPKMLARVAVMRKLLHAIFGMFKHHQLYDGSKVFRLPEASQPAPSGDGAEEAA